MDSAEVEKLAVQIRRGKDIPQARSSIANVIRRELEARRKHLGTWEKMYLAQAVRCLHHNMECSPQPTNHWLMLALVNVHKACVPAQERNEDYVKPEDLSWITYDLISDSLQMTGLESAAHLDE